MGSADGQRFSRNSSQILFIHQALLAGAEKKKKSGKTALIMTGVSFCGVQIFILHTAVSLLYKITQEGK